MFLPKGMFVTCGIKVDFEALKARCKAGESGALLTDHTTACKWVLLNNRKFRPVFKEILHVLRQTTLPYPT